MSNYIYNEDLEEEMNYQAQEDLRLEARKKHAIQEGTPYYCEKCVQYYTEDDLVDTTIDHEPIKACPDCMTDEHLLNFINE